MKKNCSIFYKAFLMVKSNPLVSIAMSVFNAEQTLEESLNSLIYQTYENIEILIMDDGSTDNTKDILKKYQKIYPKIKLFENNVNIGLTKSLNILISKAEGEIIARHDSDDISMINRIEIQMKTLYEENLDFCTSRALIMNTKKKIPGLSFYISPKKLIRYKNPFIHGTLLIKKTLLSRIGFYNESFKFAQDYKLFSDLLSTECRFKNINEPLYLLNMENNISSNLKEAQNYYAKCVRKKIDPIDLFEEI